MKLKCNVRVFNDLRMEGAMDDLACGEVCSTTKEDYQRRLLSCFRPTRLVNFFTCNLRPSPPIISYVRRLVNEKTLYMRESFLLIISSMKFVLGLYVSNVFTFEPFLTPLIPL